MGFRREPDSGRLWFDGAFVCYDSATCASWRLPISEIRIIGEMTNSLGPFVDDYFFCFARDSGGWAEASYYAEGSDVILRDLGEHLEVPLHIGLAGSTDFASRIIWPASLVDQPMFEFTDLVPRGFWQRLRNFFVQKNLQTLSHVALQYLPAATNSATHENGADCLP